MQKPHVLQWLALGGRHMLHVEQYLRHSHSLVSSELSSTLLSRVSCMRPLQQNWMDHSGYCNCPAGYHHTYI